MAAPRKYRRKTCVRCNRALTGRQRRYCTKHSPTSKKSAEPAEQTALEYIRAGRLRVPKGLQEGEIFKLPPHLDAFLEQAYDSDEDIIPLSMGRGSGKTGMIAAVAVAESETGGRHKEIAASGGHENSSEEIQATVLKMLEDGKIEHREQGRKVTNLRTGSVMHFPTGGDSSGLAKTLDIILSDEVAYWRPNSKLLGRFESSLSKLPHARMIAISTRGDAPSDNGFEELLSREDHNPHIYSPDELEVGADPFNRKFLHQANPGIEWALPDLAGLEKALRRAQKSARALRIYKAFNLNLPTVDEGVGVPLLDPTEVARCLVRRDELPPKAGPAILGVDLGGTMSLSATCAIWPLTGRCQWHGFFPSGKGLAERGTLDRVGPLYEEAHALGELSFAGDLIIDEALLLSAAVALWPDIAEVVADPFRMQALQKAARALSLRFHERRVGYLSAGPDILELQEQVASQWLQIEIGRLMLSSIGNAKVKVNETRLEVLDRRKSSAQRRNDLAQALILAAGEAGRWRDRNEKEVEAYERSVAVGKIVVPTPQEVSIFAKAKGGVSIYGPSKKG